MGNRASKYGDPCTPDRKECNSFGLVCSNTFRNGTCICMPGARHIEEYCRPVVCNGDEECQQVWGPNSNCSTSPYSRKGCACSAEWINGTGGTFLEDGRCAVGKLPGDGCISDVECSGIMGWGAHCQVGHADPAYNGTCQCKETHTWDIDGRRCLVNSHCHLTKECDVDIEIASDLPRKTLPKCDYYTGQCKCLVEVPGYYVYAKEFNSCYQTMVYNQTCEGDEECRASLGPEVECSNREGQPNPKVCQCPMGTKASGNYSETETNTTHCTPADGGVPEGLHILPGDDTTSSSDFPLMLVFGLATAAILIVLAVGAYFIRRRSLKRRHQLTISFHEEVEMTETETEITMIQDSSYERICTNLSIPIFATDNITSLEKVGQGFFGTVFKGEMDGKTVALKMFPSGQLADAIQELETMASFSHPNILSLLGVVKFNDIEPPGLLLEFMEHGDLIGLLRSDSFKPDFRQFEEATSNVSVCQNQPSFQLTQTTLKRISCQIAEGMKYLSHHHFIHRDLAARNCLVDGTGNVKVSDFGLSRDVYSNDYYQIGGNNPLPVRWMSPESLLYGRFTLESDVWAYGVLLWEIYTLGMQPYYGRSNDEVVELIKTHVLLKSPEDCPAFIHGIMIGCWMKEPKDRMTYSQICERLESADAYRDCHQDAKEYEWICGYKIPGTANQANAE